jgi:hypothetical protein
MLAGIGLVSTLAAAVAAHFVHEDQHDELKAIAARLDLIEEVLDSLAGRMMPSDNTTPRRTSAEPAVGRRPSRES